MALELALSECAQAKPTAPLDPPENKVDARKDLCKLFVHRVLRGTLASDIEGMFAKANGTIGVEHACDVEAVHGKFLGPETPPDASRTTSCYVEFAGGKRATRRSSRCAARRAPTRSGGRRRR